MLNFVNYGIRICLYFTNVYNLLNLLLIFLKKINYFNKKYDIFYLNSNLSTRL